MAAMLWVPEHVLTSSDPFGDEYDATGLGTPVHLAGDVPELMDIRPITHSQKSFSVASDTQYESSH